MKKCSKCATEKPLSQFNRDRSKKDGLTYQCKECRKASATRWRRTPEGREKWNAYQRKRYAEDPQGERLRRYTMRKERPWYQRAHNAVHHAIRAGNMPPASELLCDDWSLDCHGGNQYHYDSYLPGDELKVRCLCARHHRLWHMNNTVVTPDD